MLHCVLIYKLEVIKFGIKCIMGCNSFLFFVKKLHSYLQLFCDAVLLWLDFICTRLQLGETISQPKSNHDVWKLLFYFIKIDVFGSHAARDLFWIFLFFVDVTCIAWHCASQLCTKQNMPFVIDNIEGNLVTDFE